MNTRAQIFELRRLPPPVVRRTTADEIQRGAPITGCHPQPRAGSNLDHKQGSCVVRLSSSLYRAARLVNTAGALSSGRPSRAARRVKNIAVGRAIGRAGGWSRLWK